MIQENPDGKNAIDGAEIVLRGEDLYLKSGYVGLQTDYTRDAYFTDFSIEPLACFQDPYEPEWAEKYQVKTNRYHELYFANIDQIWEQPENAENRWIYKKNYFGRKEVLYHKMEKDKVSHGIYLMNKVFDIGTVQF